MSADHFYRNAKKKYYDTWVGAAVERSHFCTCTQKNCNILQKLSSHMSYSHTFEKKKKCSRFTINGVQFFIGHDLGHRESHVIRLLAVGTSTRMADVEEEASFLQGSVIHDIWERNRRNERLFEVALQQQQAAMHAMHSDVQTETESLYAYKHPKDAPTIAATALIRPQASIASWSKGFKNFLSLGKDLPIVIQTLRCTYEEERDIILQQKAYKLPVRWPPTVESVQRMTMDERALYVPADIGYLRITFQDTTVAELKFHTDVLIPCFFASKSAPVVGLGPAVVVDASKFLWHLDNMMSNMVANDAQHGFIILDYSQIMFGITYRAGGTTPATIQQSSGKYIEAPTIDNSHVTYLTYNNPSIDESGKPLQTSSTFVVNIPELEQSMDDWYSTKWSFGDILKCIRVLDQPAKLGGGGGGGGDVSAGMVNCKMEISHAFIPPKSFRQGWSIDKVLPSASLEAGLSDWWGYIESIRLNVSLDTDSHVLSEKALYKAVGQNDTEMWRQVPKKALDQYVELIAQSMPDGREGAIRVLENLVAKHWPDDDNILSSSMLQIPILRFTLSKLQSCLAAAKNNNCHLVSKHRKTSGSPNDAPAIMWLYQYDNEMPNANKSKNGASFDDKPPTFREPQRSNVSSYMMRPVTMSLLLTPNAVVNRDGAQSGSMDSSTFAPNGVEWKKLMPDIAWSNDCDGLEVRSTTVRRTHEFTDDVDFAAMEE